MDWSSAMLYPVPRRMEKDGLVRSEWRVSEENRMRKYYSLTVAGLAEALGPVGGAHHGGRINGSGPGARSISAAHQV